MPGWRSRRSGWSALYVVLELAGAGVGHLDFTAPLLVAGIGMGMVFVPLFDIILAGVRRPRGRLGVRRAAGAPAARDVARRRRPRDAVLRPGRLAGRSRGDFVAAAEPTMLVTVALLAVAFAIGFLLPRHAREHAAA